MPGGSRDDRPGHAAGARRGAARRRRRDGSGARALGPLREHQGAARLLDRALRPGRADDRAGRAHAGAPGGDARRGGGGARAAAAPGCRVRAERPLHGRDAPARHHAGLGRRRPRPRVLARASCRRGRDAAGEHAGGCDRADPGGRRDPAGGAHRRRAPGAARQHAQARRAARRPARAGGVHAGGGGPPARARSPVRPPAAGRGDGRALPLQRAAHPRRDRPAAERALPRRGRHRGRRHPHARHPDPGRGADRGLGGRGRLRRHGAPAAGQRQLPARRHPLRRLLRRAGGVRPGHPGVGRRLRARDGARSGGLPGERPAARARSSPGTRRRRAGSSTSSPRRSGRRSTCPPTARGR